MRARRKPAAGALKSSLPSQIYRVIADTIPQMVWTADAAGFLDYVNRRVYEYSGKTAETFAASDWPLMVHPQDWPFARVRWQDAVRDGTPFESQHRLRRADGQYRWHLVAARPLRDDAGRVMKWFGTCTDVEDQVRASQILARRRNPVDGEWVSPADTSAEGRLRSIMTLSSDFFWETDAEHRFTRLEAGGRFGRFGQVAFAASRLGKTRWEVPSVLPDAEGWRAHREVLEKRIAFRDFETARADVNGAVHYYSVDGEPVFGDGGRFLGYRGVGREITARKRAEQEMRHRDRRFRDFLDSMPAAAWIKDSSLRYVWVSASFSRVLGMQLAEIRGLDDFAICPAERAQHYRRGDERALHANGPVQSVDVVHYADGRIARWLVVKFPIPDDKGALGVAGLGFDMTADYVGSDAPGAPVWQDPIQRLSGRERQVLRLVVEGFTSAEIADRLALSPKSVDTYRSRLMTKLGIEDLPSLVKFAIRCGLTTRD